MISFDSDGLPRHESGNFSFSDMDDSMPKVAEFADWYRATYPQYGAEYAGEFATERPSRYLILPVVSLCNEFISASPALDGYQHSETSTLYLGLSKDKATWGSFVLPRINTDHLAEGVTVNPADAQVIAEKGVSILCPFIEDLEPRTQSE